MFAVSDLEVGLAMRYNREHADTVSHAQAIVDAKNDEIAGLRSKLRAMAAELNRERAARQSLEFEVDRLNRFLDMPLD